jgi:hypothetical protein
MFLSNFGYAVYVAPEESGLTIDYRHLGATVTQTWVNIITMPLRRWLTRMFTVNRKRS